MKRYIVPFFFILLVLGTAFLQYRNTLPGKKASLSPSFSIRQTIEIDGVKKASPPFSIRGKQTALQILTSTHTVISQGEKENAFITAIDGRSAAESKREFWAFYVNGKQADVGAGSYILKNNDTIEWKIETY